MYYNIQEYYRTETNIACSRIQNSYHSYLLLFLAYTSFILFDSGLRKAQDICRRSSPYDARDLAAWLAKNSASPSRIQCVDDMDSLLANVPLLRTVPPKGSLPYLSIPESPSHACRSLKCSLAGCNHLHSHRSHADYQHGLLTPGPISLTLLHFSLPQYYSPLPPSLAAP